MLDKEKGKKMCCFLAHIALLPYFQTKNILKLIEFVC